MMAHAVDGSSGIFNLFGQIIEDKVSIFLGKQLFFGKLANYLHNFITGRISKGIENQHILRAFINSLKFLNCNQFKRYIETQYKYVPCFKYHGKSS